jgi:hypothetical protein
MEHAWRIAWAAPMLVGLFAPSAQAGYVVDLTQPQSVTPVLS